MAPAPEAETAEQAEERCQQFEAQQQAHQQEEERRAELRKQQEEKQREAEFAKRDKLRKKREATFERIVAEAPPVLSPVQLRVLLRALVNLDPYTFADDLAGENVKRSAEEVLLALIEGTDDDKLTSFAARLALAGHRGIPRENELDFLAEAEAAFLTPPSPRRASQRRGPGQEEGADTHQGSKGSNEEEAHSGDGDASVRRERRRSLTRFGGLATPPPA